MSRKKRTPEEQELRRMLIEDEYWLGDDWYVGEMPSGEMTRRKDEIKAMCAAGRPKPEIQARARALGFCGATKSTKELPHDVCLQRAGSKTPHPGWSTCRLHGGGSGRVILGGKLMAIRRAATVLGEPREVDPHDALLERVYTLAGIVDWIESVLRGQEEATCTWGVIEEVDDGQKIVVKSKAEPSVWLRLHRQYSADLVKCCETAIKCGLAERQVRLAESEGRLIARVIEQTLRRLDINPNDHNVRQIVGEVMGGLGPGEVVEAEVVN